MKLIPVLTEKSLAEAKKGNYTFWVLPGMNKNQIKKAISQVFGVNVVSVRTMNYQGIKRRNFKGQIQTTHPRKKTIVTLKDKEKIDLFEEKK
ncbi:MAG: 50S ribosomal protein L23 [Candidatus Woesebacteria bacterium GW2011_GWC1_43_10b]|uniref:Large ribosomal subunit protein uL23 n=2 Tax=Candidatus Woeseibacteriota TaxID=1752722 RepID=A0A0G1GH82_9BACT|nr:MAG: 50S ribosomal protein L23 [Candidatus Woesebacteria bacterium GW2011_GWC1_43_10b]KKT34311.1 MAG: 50S ribosomal protein L23 [Candidatus Woesebacteria bacterium GW2011_GWB1_44_11b]